MTSAFDPKSDIIEERVVRMRPGCIRMTNQDVIDLYNRVQIGATVIVQ